MKEEKMFCFKVIREDMLKKTNVYIPVKAYNIIDAIEKLKVELLSIAKRFVELYKRKDGDTFKYDLIVNKYNEINIVRTGLYSSINNIVFSFNSFELIADEITEKDYMDLKVEYK